MALKKIIKNNSGNEAIGFLSGFFINENNYHNLDQYSSRTGKEQSDVINELLEDFFKSSFAK